MQTIAGLIAVLLAAIAFLHVYRGFGGVWPGNDQKSCARAVAGFKGIDRMPPPAACFAVAAILSVVMVLALAVAGIVALPLPVELARLAAMLAALAFLARGVIGFMPFWRRITPEMPFARNDRRWFSPLCILVGVGLLSIALRAPAIGWSILQSDGIG